MACRRNVCAGAGTLVLFDRALDSAGATVEFFLSAFRDVEAAKSLFGRALRDGANRQPRVINDLAPTYPRTIAELRHNGALRRCRHRPVQYLNNIVEQDHRFIKKRVNAKQGFRAFNAARRTIQGYEAMHMLRKGQVRWLARTDVQGQVRFIHRLFGIAV